MNKFILYIFLLLGTFLYSHPVVENLDLQRFMGRWYVIALIPNWVEEGATNSYDDYELNQDGSIDVTYKAIKDGKQQMIKQKAVVVDKNIPSRWDMSFIEPWIPFYSAPYEVIVLDEDYEYMVVGYPDNSYGWIMSRKTSMQDKVFENILNVLDRDFGYNKKDFQKVIHDN